jgi:acyl-CoA thioester hydrolase
MNNNFIVPIQIRWSDIDANRHLRHSVYYDYGAFCRMKIFTEIGITLEKLGELSIGPVLLREEAVFRREIVFEDQIAMTTEVLKATSDFGRWTFRHTLIKNEGILAAVITIDGAWIDTQKRKLTIIPDEFREAFEKIPKAAEFETIEVTKKPV